MNKSRPTEEELMSDLLEETTSLGTAPAFTIVSQKMNIVQAEVDDLHLLTIVLNSVSQNSLGLLNESSTEDGRNISDPKGTLSPTPSDEIERINIESSRSIRFVKGEPRVSPRVLISKPPSPHLRPSKIPFKDHYPLSLSELKKNKQTKSLKKLSSYVPTRRNHSNIKFSRHKKSQIVSLKNLRTYTPNILNYFKHRTLLFSFIRSKVNLHLTTTPLAKVPVNHKNTVNIQITNSKNPRIKNLRIDIE